MNFSSYSAEYKVDYLLSANERAIQKEKYHGLCLGGAYIVARETKQECT